MLQCRREALVIALTIIIIIAAAALQIGTSGQASLVSATDAELATSLN